MLSDLINERHHNMKKCFLHEYILRIIRKKPNPTLNGALTVMFGFATWIEIIPFLSKLKPLKFIKKNIWVLIN